MKRVSQYFFLLPFVFHYSILFLRLLTMNTIKCSCCGRADEPHRVVVCKLCKKNFKIGCVDISNAEARKIHSGASGLSWCCSSCLDVGNDLDSLKAIIIGLQEEIRTLKSSLQRPAISSSASLIDLESVVQEVAERERRKCNVIVYGFKESTCKSNAEQIDMDSVETEELLLRTGVKDANVQLTRLGKFDPSNTTRCRPLRIGFSSDSHVASFLRMTGALKEMDRWKQFAFSRDRTVMQRKLYNEVRQELTERLSKGDTNLKIKYKNGIPGIVSSKN